MTGTKAFLREHERDTLSNLNGGLQAREPGHSEYYRVVKTDDGTYLHTPSTKGDAILTDGLIPFADGGGRLSEHTGLAWGTAATVLIVGTSTIEKLNGTTGTFLSNLNVDGGAALTSIFRAGDLTWNNGANSGVVIARRGSDDYAELQINNNAAAGSDMFSCRTSGGGIIHKFINNGNCTHNGTITAGENVKISSIPSGATQVASGVSAGEFWKTASHASLPDNVLMIGV